VLLSFQDWGKGSGPGKKVELKAGETVVIGDVVHTVTARDAGGLIRFNATAPVTALARTYNQDARGTYGQTILPVTTMENGIFLFLREDASFRSNLGLYNPAEHDVEYGLELVSANGESLGHTTVAVPAGSAIQVNRVVERFGIENLETGYLRITGGAFGGYVSAIDNATGDGSTVTPSRVVPAARVTGASVFGELHSLRGPLSPGETSIFILDIADWSVVARPTMDSDGGFSARLPGQGEYWLMAGTNSGEVVARLLHVADSPVHARLLLRPVVFGTGALAAPRSIRKVMERIGTGTVSVVVKNACDEEGIAHADVRLVNVATGLIVASEETGADGRVTFNDVPVDDQDTQGGELSTYLVFAGGWVLNKYDSCHYGKVLLGVGDVVETEIKMVPKDAEESCYGTIKGHVEDRCKGEGLAGAEIRVFNGLSDNGCEDADILETANADGNGDYVLEKVIPGLVELFASDPSMEECVGDCLECYWPGFKQVDVQAGQVATADYSLQRKGIIFLGQVKDAPAGDPVEFAKVDLVNVNPRATTHGPLWTQEDGLFIFNTATGPAFAGGSSGNLSVTLTDPDNSSCTTTKSFELCDWDYDEILILSCSETWSGSYTTTLSYSDELVSKNGTATGQLDFTVDASGNISGTAVDDQLITITTPGCTTTYDGGGVFTITGERTADGFRLFFDDEDAFVYAVTQHCQGIPDSHSTETGSARLQYAPKLELVVNPDGTSVQYQDTHTVEHVGTYTIDLTAARK